MGISGSSGTTGNAGGSSCSASAQGLGEHGSHMEQGSSSRDGDKGHSHPSHCPTWPGLQSSPGLAAYQRSSVGMRLIRDFSSSAASRESSGGEGEGPECVCLDLSIWELGATWLNWMPELCSDVTSTQEEEMKRTTLLLMLHAPSDKYCQQLGYQFPGMVKVVVSAAPSPGAYLKTA